MPEPLTTRARWHLAAMVCGLVIAFCTLPLFLSARADRHVARRLADDTFSFESAAGELQTLALALQLDAVRLAYSDDPEPLVRANESRRSRLEGAIRRARVHAPGGDAVDVIDDFENTALRLDAVVDRITGRNLEGGRAGELLAAANDEGQHLDDLAEELTTIAETQMADDAAAIAGISRPFGLALLLVAALALCVHAFAQAWLDSGSAMRAVLSLPWSGLQRLRRTKKTESVTEPDPQSAAGSNQEESPGVILDLPNQISGELSTIGEQAVILNLRDNPEDETAAEDPAA